MKEFVCSGVGKDDFGHLRIENGQCDEMDTATPNFELMKDVEFASLNSVEQQPTRAKTYCAQLSIRDLGP
ncbi:hypothetical protein TNCV_4458181 [Trichonephila clavipes]|nr:hypothetical protein TNCV_4458181 [Trichonephila clavipes]